MVTEQAVTAGPDGSRPSRLCERAPVCGTRAGGSSVWSRWAEDIVHYAVAVLLVGVAAVVLMSSVGDFVDAEGHTLPERVTAVINSVLFVIIVMEILRTVVAHVDDAGLQLKPFPCFLGVRTL